MSAPPILWASPLPPTRSGVADYAAELLPHLARLRPLRLVKPPGSEPQLGVGTPLPSVPSDAPPPGGAISLLHLGNNPYHLWVAQRLRRFGGIAVIHDLVLHHLLIEEAASEGAWARYAAELEAAYGPSGRALAEARAWGFAGTLEPFLYPATEVYLKRAQGAIVHSTEARRYLARVAPSLPTVEVPLAIAPFPGADRRSWRMQLGVADDELVLVHLGFLTAAKGLAVILEALAAAASLGVKFRFVVVGEGSEATRLETLAAHGGLQDRLLRTGYASPEELGGVLAAADLGLVPRFPTAGETSAAALRFFAAGVPVVVSGYRQFLELPREAAFRIAPGRAGVSELVRLLLVLRRDADALVAARVAAREASVSHRPEDVAGKLDRAVDELAGDR